LAPFLEKQMVLKLPLNMNMLSLKLNSGILLKEPGEVLVPVLPVAF
jgi:hypothetical protein